MARGQTAVDVDGALAGSVRRIGVVPYVKARFLALIASRVLRNSASRLFKKGQMRGARENRSFDFVQDRLEAYLPIR